MNKIMKVDQIHFVSWKKVLFRESKGEPHALQIPAPMKFSAEQFRQFIFYSFHIKTVKTETSYYKYSIDEIPKDFDQLFSMIKIGSDLIKIV